MSASRADTPWRRAAAALLTGGLLLAAAPVLHAQDARQEGAGDAPAGPIPLFPPSVRPAPDAAGEPSAAERPTEWTQSDTIEVNRLGELNPAALGILDPEHGGLGGDTWAGSDRAEVAALLRDLPGDPGSPTLHRLAARLLLSSARPPAPTRSSTTQPLGPAPQAETATVADAITAGRDDTDFLRLRAERLHAMGELAGLNRLLALVPQRVEDPWLAEARVEGLLLAGRDAEACAQVPAGLARYPQSLYWSKAQIFCQVVAGETDRATLGLDLLREAAPAEEQGFVRLADAFIAGSADTAADAALTPLTLAMLRRDGGSLSLETVSRVEPLLLHGIAALTGGDHVVQAAGAERLAQMGVLSGERLAGAYQAFEFTDAELGDALAEAERIAGRNGGDVRGRALLYRAASRETLPATRAEILRAAFLSAEADGRAAAMARAAVPLLEELPPTPDLAWFAPLAARTLYRAGQFERAGAWLSVLRLDGQRHAESLEAYEALRPLRRLAGGPEPLSSDAVAAPLRLRLFVLSRALGQEEDFVWVEAAGSPAEPLERLPRLLALGDAAAAGRRGETVLRAIAALGPAPVEGQHPLALGYAVSALGAVGLGGDARALAIEAALAAGL